MPITLTFALGVVLSALLSVAATPLFARLARRSGLVVVPRGDRWSKTPVPLLGGAAMALATLVSFALLLPLNTAGLTLIVCAAAAFSLGLLDDFRSVAPTTKLVGQVMVGVLLVAGGIGVEFIDFAPVTFLLTIFWVVGMMNALNLVDNMDGLAGGLAAIAASAIGLSALQDGNVLAVVISAVTAGSALGFLVHNFYPARVFMGDAGSLLLGFLLSASALVHTASGAANVGLALLGPLTVLALPIFDTALVATSRRLAGRPISQGGRDHTSHRLAALGLSDRGVVLFLYAVAIALAGVGAAAEAISGVGLALIMLVCVALVLFGVFLHEVEVYGRKSEESNSDDGRRERLLQSIWIYCRFGGEVAIDVVLLTIAYYVSYAVRFESTPADQWLPVFAQSVPIVIGVQLAALVGLGVYRTLWRFLSITDAVRIVRAVTVGTAASSGAIFVISRFDGYSRAVFVLDWVFAAALIIGARSFSLWLRHYFSGRQRFGERRVLIVGATESGALALRLVPRAGGSPLRAVGFVDDDPGKRYRRIGGVPILGTTEELGTMIKTHSIDLVVVALDPSASGYDRTRETCRLSGVECREFLTLR